MAPARNDTLDALQALSVALDLANGFDDGKSLRTAALGALIAEALGLQAEQRTAAWFAGLLRHLGCTAFSHEESSLLGRDEVALRNALLRVETTDTAGIARAVWSAPRTSPLLSAVRALASTAGRTGAVRAQLVQANCEVASRLAARLHLPAAVTTALGELFERYDGRGDPRGLSGDEISPVGRVVPVAELAVLFARTHGIEAALRTLEARKGGQLDPAVVDAARSLEDVLDAVALGPAVGDIAQAVLASLAAPMVSLEGIATALGDFVDLLSPYTQGHARSVASHATRVAERLGLDDASRGRVRLAALVHDVGAAAIPASLWSRAGALSPAEHERLRSHGYFGERVLGHAPCFAELVPLVAQHHERLDGSGYPRNLRGAAVPLGARILAASDVYDALCSDRPHRAALGPSEASRTMRSLVAQGQLDADVVNALLDPHGPTAIGATKRAALSAREREVLRWVTRGLSNKEIAERLRISPRTVQQHTINIYDRLGVRTRAAAALAAIEQGWLDGAE